VRALALLLVSITVSGCERSRPRTRDASPPTSPAPAAMIAPDAYPETPATLAPGRWERGFHEYCVEIFADGTIEVSHQGKMARNPARISGGLRAFQIGADTYRVVVEVAHIRQTQLARCRKNWFVAKLKQLTLLGRTATPGAPLELTFRFGADRQTLTVCGAAEQCVELTAKKPSGRTTAGEHPND
jgi:hypothetical protein